MSDLIQFDPGSLDSMSREAYADGKEAFALGFSIEDNTYIDEDIDLELVWEQGWREAEREYNERRR